MSQTASKLIVFSLITMSMAILLASCTGQEEPTPVAEPVSAPSHTPENTPTEAAAEQPSSTPVPTAKPSSTPVPTEKPGSTPVPAEKPTMTVVPPILGEPLIEFSADSMDIVAGECTTLRWRTENVVAVFVHPIFDAYDKYPVESEGSREVCPAETLPYLLRANLADGSPKAKAITIVVSEGEEPES